MLMNFIKKIGISFIASVVVVIAVEYTLFLLIGGNRNFIDILIPQSPLFFLMPVNILYNGRPVKREYLKEDFDEEKFNSILNKYKTIIRSSESGLTIYKTPWAVLISNDITKEEINDVICLHAPIRMIREYES